MKLKLFLCCLAIGLIVTSCKNRTNAGDASTDIESANDIPHSEEGEGRELEEKPEIAEVDMDDQGRDEQLGVQTLKGRLVLDKGVQPRVNDVFIGTDAFKEDGKNWKVRVQELKGKTIEVKGMVVRHWCGPMEQCLSEGFMDRMSKVDYLKVHD